jgi:hypothetical protein
MMLFIIFWKFYFKVGVLSSIRTQGGPDQVQLAGVASVGLRHRAQTSTASPLSGLAVHLTNGTAGYFLM